MPAPLLRLGRLALIVAMFCAIGGHWLVLQTVAWSRMLVDYSQAASLTVAVGKTFDGRHPCALCKSIAAAQQSGKKQEAGVEMKKLDVFHQPAAQWIAPVLASWEQPLADAAPVQRAQPPSVPPPRTA